MTTWTHEDERHFQALKARRDPIVAARLDKLHAVLDEIRKVSGGMPLIPPPPSSTHVATYCLGVAQIIDHAEKLTEALRPYLPPQDTAA